MGGDARPSSGELLVARRPDGTVELYLRHPRGPRGGYSIIRRTHHGGAGRSAETVESEALAAVNRELRAGRLTRDEAAEAARRELARLRELAGGGRRRTLLSAANLRTLQRYWDAEFEHRHHVDKPAAWNRLRRAVEALGDVPLTASREELQRQVNRAARGNKHRAIVFALNPLLAFLGRAGVQLEPGKRERRRIRYLTLSQFRTVLAHIIDPYFRLMCGAAFATGCRAGELFSLPSHIRDGVVTVEWQVRRGEKKDAETKNRRVRDVPIIPEAAEWLVGWLELDARMELRGRRHAEILRAACRAGKLPEITFHGLRDSYAIHLLSRGVSVALVAQALGDSEAVVQEHYAGFVLTEPGVEAVKRLLSAT
jgi:hypothetical protein